jgi:hypothetical protein
MSEPDGTELETPQVEAAETEPPELQVPEPRTVMRVALASEAGLALLALCLGSLFRLAPLDQIEWTVRGVSDGILASVPLLAGLLAIVRYPIGPFKALKAVSEQLIIPLFRRCSVGQVLIVSLLAGFGEELLFRAVAQRGIEVWSGSPWFAVIVASVLFGLAHPISVTYVVLAALVGAYLGWLLVATDNLLVPIATHAAYDFVAIVYLVSRAPKTENESLVNVSP